MRGPDHGLVVPRLDAVAGRGVEEALVGAEKGTVERARAVQERAVEHGQRVHDLLRLGAVDPGVGAAERRAGLVRQVVHQVQRAPAHRIPARIEAPRGLDGQVWPQVRQEPTLGRCGLAGGQSHREGRRRLGEQPFGQGRRATLLVPLEGERPPGARAVVAAEHGDALDPGAGRVARQDGRQPLPGDRLAVPGNLAGRGTRPLEVVPQRTHGEAIAARQCGYVEAECGNRAGPPLVAARRA